MSKGEWLSKELKEYRNRTGGSWKARVAVAADVSIDLIKKVMLTGHTPKEENCWSIARAVDREDAFKALFGQTGDAA